MHDYNNEHSDWAGKRALDVFLVGKLGTLADCGAVWGSASIRRAG